MKRSVTTAVDVGKLLGRRISMTEIDSVVEWAMDDDCNKAALFGFAQSSDEKTCINALWVLSHLPRSATGWLQSKQNGFVDMLLSLNATSNNTSKKRILLQILMKLSYDKQSIRTDFLDYCFSKINAECEPYAIRCYSIYCALKMCRFYPELTAELGEYIAMLSTQSLSPGLKCALRNAKARIKQFDFNYGKD